MSLIARHGLAALLALAWLPVAAQGNFDIERYSNDGEGMFETFHVAGTELLAAALEKGVVAEQTQLLIAQTAAGPLALLTDQMAFHHIAQGTAAGKDWMATF